MNETVLQYAILGLLAEHSYLATWHIEDKLGVENFGGCGVPGPGDDALRALVKAGKIEEMEELGCRYRLVKEVAK